MARGEQRRPLPPRVFYRKHNQMQNPLDQASMMPTHPAYLAEQGGLQKDVRRAAGSYDAPHYTGDLSPARLPSIPYDDAEELDD